jgi:putative transposase
MTDNNKRQLQNYSNNRENSTKDKSRNNNFDYEEFKKSAIEKLYAGKGILGKEGAFTPLIKEFLEAALQGELSSHLEQNNISSKKEDFDSHATEGFYSQVSHNGNHSAINNNKRNGTYHKQVKTDCDQFDLEVPRDRDSSFNPQIVKKRQTVLTEDLDKKIIGLYGLGMSYSDISKHIKELYDIDISTSTMTNVTDKIIPKIAEFKARQLEEVYPIIYLDAIFFKVKENGKIISKAFYSVLGIGIDGKKDILGIYVSEAEGANFWLNVLTDLKNRGVKDVLIACVDGLKGFPEAINNIFPDTEIQLCIIHQIRNSLKYVASKNQKEFMDDLKDVYKANSKELAETKLLELDEKWGKKYPIVLKSWQNNWDNLSAYFKYPDEIRRIIYTTNAVEGFHRQIRKVTKTKGSFSSNQALEKLLYLAIQNISKKWNMPIQNWSLIIGQFAIRFDGRVKLDLA